MKIQEYVKKYHLSISDFSRQMLISYYTSQRYLEGSQPRIEIAKKICQLTNNEITLEDMGYGKAKLKEKTF